MPLLTIDELRQLHKRATQPELYQSRTNRALFMMQFNGSPGSNKPVLARVSGPENHPDDTSIFYAHVVKIDTTDIEKPLYHARLVLRPYHSVVEAMGEPVVFYRAEPVMADEVDVKTLRLKRKRRKIDRLGRLFAWCSGVLFVALFLVFVKALELMKQDEVLPLLVPLLLMSVVFAFLTAASLLGKKNRLILFKLKDNDDTSTLS